jgi:poly(hydroxyalkanoate) depolymerase family esterase
MIDPFRTMLKASRLAGKGRPLSAAIALLFPGTSKRKPVRRSPTKVTRPPQPRSLRPAPGSFIDGHFANAYGALNYKLHTPKGSSRRRLPIVVMLHGCTQTAGDFARGTAMNTLADELGFLVLYPEQSISANMGRCWNWHTPANQSRSAGEPAVVASLTRHVMTLCAADPRRVYIAGLSAGGCAAALTAAAYPDLYVAVGVHSAMAPGNVATLTSALAAMRSGNSGGTSHRRRPRPTIVFHGDRDDVVNPSAAAGFLSQLERSRPGVLSRQVLHDRRKGGRAFTRAIYRNQRGEVLLEDWSVHGSGHAWSGGNGAASNTDPAGPDASREMLRFFLRHRRPLKRQR